MGRWHGDGLGWQWKVYLVPASLDCLQDVSLVGGETIKCLGYSNG